MKNGERAELDKLRAEKERKQKYTYDYNARNYYRAVCLFPAARRGELDRAIHESGAGSVSAYLLRLVYDDLARRGIGGEGSGDRGGDDESARG